MSSSTPISTKQLESSRVSPTRTADSRSNTLLIEALGDPLVALAFDPAQWARLIGQARSADLLGRIAACADARGALDAIPDGPRSHLESALLVGAAQEETVRREVRHLALALRSVDVDLVLLKGAAYVMAQLPAARGRLFSDIDILVPIERLPDVESALMMHGWATTHHNPYDQHYYRRWMHELPPMRHVTRGTTLDVHHNILPTTARRTPDARLIIAAAPLIDPDLGIRVLSPEDMVLHSATHLFVNDDLSHVLRDLVDIQALLLHFGNADFWPKLIARSHVLHLDRYLHYALRYADQVLGSPIPASLVRNLRAAAPSPPVRALMDGLYRRAFDCAPGEHRLAQAIVRQCLYVRGHWLRMPPWLLAYHLTVKALRREDEPEP